MAPDPKAARGNAGSRFLRVSAQSGSAMLRWAVVCFLLAVLRGWRRTVALGSETVRHLKAPLRQLEHLSLMPQVAY